MLEFFLLQAPTSISYNESCQNLEHLKSEQKKEIRNESHGFRAKTVEHCRMASSMLATTAVPVEQYIQAFKRPSKEKGLSSRNLGLRNRVELTWIKKLHFWANKELIIIFARA